jgi:hypothetical protein
MAIISCPGCRKNISSRTTLCTYCGFQSGEVSAEQLREFSRRKLRDRIYHLKMTSYAALALLIAAFGWYLADSSGFQPASSIGPVVLFLVGAFCYLVIRIFLFKAKAALKKLSVRALD